MPLIISLSLLETAQQISLFYVYVSPHPFFPVEIASGRQHDLTVNEARSPPCAHCCPTDILFASPRFTLLSYVILPKKLEWSSQTHPPFRFAPEPGTDTHLLVLAVPSIIHISARSAPPSADYSGPFHCPPASLLSRRSECSPLRSSTRQFRLHGHSPRRASAICPCPK